MMGLWATRILKGCIKMHEMFLDKPSKYGMVAEVERVAVSSVSVSSKSVIVSSDEVVIGVVL